MDSLLSNFVQDLGLGELPILSEENKQLNQELVAKQLEIAKLTGLNTEEGAAVERIFGHWNNVRESTGIAKNVKISKRRNIETERNLVRFSEVCAERNYRDSSGLRTDIDDTIEKNESLEEDITAKATINELLEDEHTSDVETLLQWASDLDSHEEDILSLLKYQNADQNRIKQIHLKLENLRQDAAREKKVYKTSAHSILLPSFGQENLAFILTLKLWSFSKELQVTF